MCKAFFQKLPEQDVSKTFILLLPGRPLVAQGKAWTKCEVEGLVRLRNLATATSLASFKSMDDVQRESFRIADKESASLFFSNGSIFLVATSKENITVSQSLRNLPWKPSSQKIVDLEFSQVETLVVARNFALDVCQRENCSGYHACCGTSCLCIRVVEFDSVAPHIGDVTNFQKKLEDDVTKRVLNAIFDDNSFVMNTNVRCVRPKLQ